MGKKMLALRLRSSSTWFASPLTFFSSPIFSSARRKKCSPVKNNTQQTNKLRQNKQAGHRSPEFPQKREKNTSTSAFQSGGSAPYPPGSNCLFSSLDGSLSSGLQLIFLQTIFDEANDVGFGYRFASRYRLLPGGKRFPPNLNSRRRASSRRQWFVPSPSSGDIAVFFLLFFFFNLTYSRWTSSLPSCLWSQRIFPSLPGSRLTIFYRDASSALLQLVN